MSTNNPNSVRVAAPLATAMLGLTLLWAASAPAIDTVRFAPIVWAIGAQAGSAEPLDDHQHMLDQLGVKRLRPGADPNNQAIFDERHANPYAGSMPDALTTSDGVKVTRPEQWPARRAEIVDLFEREIYGRIPSSVPRIAWKAVETTRGEIGGVAVVTRLLVGRVDNSASPDIEVNVEAKFTVPAEGDQPRPVMIHFDGFGRRFAPRVIGTPWTEQAIARGWGFGSIDPGSVQPDNNNFRVGIIGLTNKGQPRTPEQWGALRAWGWGVSRLIDAFEQHPEWGVDPRKVGVVGVSRYGKAALVTEAFDPRVAVAVVASSGEGGAKLHRHVFGEAVENLTGGLYYWMAGNFIKYGAAEATFGAKTAADLPVDSHQLIALCAPRPCFICYGVVERGDPPWVDAHGSFMAGVLAGPVYQLLGKRGLGTPGDYLTDPMPAVNELIGGELAWLQHSGGHDVTPAWPAFFEWIGQYVSAPPVAKTQAAANLSASAESDGSAATTEPSSSPSPVRGVPRGDENSQIAHRELVAKAQQGGIDLYFLGDSITRRWGTSDVAYQQFMENWRKNFFGWNAGNFGWGADSTLNILWRIENGELDGVNPKVIVLLAGTNDVGGQGASEAKLAEIAGNIAAILRVCHEKAPRTTIILTAVFPRAGDAALRDSIAALNRRLASLCDGKTIRYLNVNAKLTDAQGNLLPGMTVDGLHPALPGYQVWADGLKPLLTELLGEPAKEDHAPPPTGDPSAG